MDKSRPSLDFSEKWTSSGPGPNLAPRVEFGSIRLVKFQIFWWCLKAKFQIPLSAEGCL